MLLNQHVVNVQLDGTPAGVDHYLIASIVHRVSNMIYLGDNLNFAFVWDC